MQLSSSRRSFAKMLWRTSPKQSRDNRQQQVRVFRARNLICGRSSDSMAEETDSSPDPEEERSRQYYPSMRAGPPNPGPRSAATRAGMKSGPARIRGVSIVVPTCKPAKLRAAGTDFCGKLQPARNRFSFCGLPECNGGPAGGTSRRKNRPNL